MAKTKSKKDYGDSKNKDKALQIALNTLEKQFGKGIVMTGNSTSFPEVGRINSGSIGLDIALNGGIARGRIVEIYGPESCIYRGSYIPYEIWSADDKERINHKGGTIGRLYERFHNRLLEDLPKQGRHLQTKKTTKFYVKSVNDEGSIIRNEVLDVVKTGKKTCYQVITENGNCLIATPEHKFLTPEGYKPLSELEVGSIVFIHNNTRRRGRKDYTKRPDIYVKYHPYLPNKVVHDKKTGNDYLYYRGQVSRLAYEAWLNGVDYDSYIHFLNTASKEEIESSQFLPNNIHVHHRDENFLNNEISNLQLIDPSEHGRLHAKDRHANLSFVMTPVKIALIEPQGPRETFDIRCTTPYNNYIAEGIVVHNSGKTTLSLHVIAECQKAGGTCAFIDAEHALDVYYAASLGVDIESLMISQPESGEDALNVAEVLTRSRAVDLIVIDSVSSLVPRAEIEGNIGDSSVGLQARIMSQAMRMLVGPAKETDTAIIFINQIRMKIGVMFGNPETTSGGNALKFYASQRLDIRRIGVLSEGEDKVGIRTRVKVVKNKVGPPFKTAEFNVVFGKGIDAATELLDLATAMGFVEKAGAWYSYGSERLGQGSANAAKAIAAAPELAQELRDRIIVPKIAKETVIEDEIPTSD